MNSEYINKEDVLKILNDFYSEKQFNINPHNETATFIYDIMISRLMGKIRKLPTISVEKEKDND